MLSKQNQLILQINNFVDSLLIKAHLNYQFTIYKVLLISKSDGSIEFIPNSTIIFDSLKQNNKIVLSFFKKISSNNREVLTNIMSIHAQDIAFLLILGIGDGYLENLMIDNRGRLFHIDIGYIPGKDLLILIEF